MLKNTLVGLKENNILLISTILTSCVIDKVRWNSNTLNTTNNMIFTINLATTIIYSRARGNNILGIIRRNLSHANRVTGGNDRKKV